MCRLAAVNFFLFLANGYQMGRIVNYNMNKKGTTVEGAAKAAIQDVEAKGKEAKAAVKDAVSK
jgi:Mitochondrial pyruvate carriers